MNDLQMLSPLLATMFAANNLLLRARWVYTFLGGIRGVTLGATVSLIN